MDGDPVTGEPSDSNEAPKTITEMFYEIFPYYLSIGMSYNEFWYGSPSLARAYRKAHEMRMKQEEWARWRTGLYNYVALLKVAPVLRPFTKGEVKPGEYPDEPFPLTEKEAKEQEQRREQENFKQFLANLEAESERNLKLRAEKEAKQDG